MIIFSSKKLQKVVEEAIDKAISTSQDDKTKILSLQKQIENLKTEKLKVKEELDDLQLKKKIDKRDIEHMVKIKEEKNEIEFEKKTVELQKEFSEKEMTILKDTHEKSMNLLEQGKKDLSDIYGKIIERLPNVNMEINRNISR